MVGTGKKGGGNLIESRLSEEYYRDYRLLLGIGKYQEGGFIPNMLYSYL